MLADAVEDAVAVEAADAGARDATSDLGACPGPQAANAAATTPSARDTFIAASYVRVRGSYPRCEREMEGADRPSDSPELGDADWQLLREAEVERVGKLDVPSGILVIALLEDRGIRKGAYTSTGPLCHSRLCDEP